tara:strand:- start:51 stop:326 length:276 start_codon:yes stop_codon:yes gene_type:complete
MSKPMSPVVCGATGKTLTEWRERTFVQRYIKGELVTIPLYLDIDHIIGLHKQSETYLSKKAAAADEQSSETSENSEVSEDTEGIMEEAPTF